MVSKIKLLPPCIAASMLLTGCADHARSVSVPVSKTASGSSTSQNISARLLDEVNDYRRSKGVKPLRRHSGLDRLARDHAQFLINRRGKFSLHGRTVSHYGFEARSILARERYNLHSVSENIASTTGGASNAPKVFRQLWINSPSHEHNMRADWKFSGMGVAVADDGTVVAVQIYGTGGMRSHQRMVDKFREF